MVDEEDDELGTSTVVGALSDESVVEGEGVGAAGAGGDTITAVVHKSLSSFGRGLASLRLPTVAKSLGKFSGWH